MKETYLGDGLYACFDGWQFILRAPREHGDHWVGLEPSVLAASHPRQIGFATASDNDAVATAKLVTGLEQLNKDLSVPAPADYGIKEADWNGKMALMAEQALASGSPGNNPRVPSGAEIVGLYREVWTGAAANR